LAFLIPASGGNVGGNVGGSGNNNNSNTNGTNSNKSVRRRRKMYSVEYLCSFSNKFISYVASYVGPIQTGFLRGFRKSSSGTGIVIPVKKVPQEQKTQESRGFLQKLPS